MNHSILSRAPKVPSIFISPRFLITIFFVIGLNISAATADDLSKKIAQKKSINPKDLDIGINISEAEFKRLEEHISEKINSKGKIFLNLSNGSILELEAIGPKLESGTFNFRLNGENFNMPNCKLNFNFTVGKAANDNQINNTNLRCNFKF
jgi:hypothetical protein